MRAVVVGIVLLCGITQGAEPKTVTNSIGMKLIEIPAGKFMMGTPEGRRIMTKARYRLPSRWPNHSG